jgi:hypothetical protein
VNPPPDNDCIMQSSSPINPATFAVIFPRFFVTLWCTVCFLLSRVSGWARLARRFRSDSRFPGPAWGWQSARMAPLCNYNHCLTFGANASGLYMSIMLLFRIGSPPLLIPWPEVTVWRRRKILFFRFVELRLGSEEQVALLVRASLADSLQSAAGSSWPVEPVS